jgi:carbamoylphosphate synthase small subunit
VQHINEDESKQNVVIFDYGIECEAITDHLKFMPTVKYTVVNPRHTSAEHIRRINPVGIILTDGEGSVYDYVKKNRPIFSSRDLYTGNSGSGIWYGL